MEITGAAVKKRAEFLVIAVAALLSLALWKAGAFRRIEYKAYDAMLPLAREIKKDTPLLLVEIDDLAIEQVGDWPWTRDIMGNALLRMKELGAERVVFDIEYLSASSLALNQKVLERAASFSDVNSLLSQLVIDADDYFSRCVQLFGNSWLTLNMQDMGLERSDDEQEYARKRFTLPVIEASDFVLGGNESVRRMEASASGFSVEKFLTPAVSPVINAARGAGFTNCLVDLDGVRRRIQLLEYDEGAYLGQLVFAPLVDLLDVRKIQRTRSRLILEDALFPREGKRQTVSIPLDESGCMLINWLHSPYAESFGGSLGNVMENRHESFAFLKQLDDVEEYIADNLYAIAGLSFAPDELSSRAKEFLDFYSQLSYARALILSDCKGFDSNGNAVDGGPNPSFLSQYFEMRSEFFASLTDFADSFREYAENLVFTADGSGGSLGKEDLSYLGDLASAFCDNIRLYNSYSLEMGEKYSGAFCLVGFTANASTDFGITPFDRIYANLGVHANIANTILQRDFITPLPALWGLAFALCVVLLVVFLARRCSLAKKICLGIIYLLLVWGVLAGMMIFLRLFIPPALPSAFVLLCFLGNSALNFIQLEKDRRTLRRGFDAYVAPEVVSQIVKNPGLLRLGGESKRLTALFSDVRKFSAFTECINQADGEERGAVRLVEILNGYLGTLSDAIMAQEGTIDKYVGDEIVSFFGAPVEDCDNAFHACVAGIRMKQAEDEYNKLHSDLLPLHPLTGTPFLLKSRVGLNTGDMVVGNMGTQKKMNYTVMGNNVNLASRLEGSCKEYDSWIIASESTWKDADSGAHRGELVARQLDCVKVVNVEKPVQIYSIIGLRGELSKEELEAAEIFNRGMEFYLDGRDAPDQPKNPEDLRKAIALFERAYACFHTSDPQDRAFISMERRMIQRCRQYLEGGIPPVWDGVFKMRTK